MRALFDQLSVEGESGIDRLVDERQQENVSLDFKEKRVATRGSLDQEDRKTLAKALSAFANSAGGLLVYGVEARKGDDGIDCAREVKPIAEIERFLSEAVTATGQLLQPRHDGIEVRAIHSVRQPGAGYLLFFVARSERRPHRSEAAGQKQYFKRAGDSSFEMEHYDIEDAFRRASVPDLDLDWEIETGVIRGGVPEFHVRLALHNESITTAKYPYLMIRNVRGAPDGIRFTLPETKYSEGQIDGWVSYTAGADVVINPGMKSVVVRKHVDLRMIHNEYTCNGRVDGPFYAFDYRIGCENSPMKEGSAVLTLDELNVDC